MNREAQRRRIVREANVGTRWSATYPSDVRLEDTADQRGSSTLRRLDAIEAAARARSSRSGGARFLPSSELPGAGRRAAPVAPRRPTAPSPPPDLPPPAAPPEPGGMALAKLCAAIGDPRMIGTVTGTDRQVLDAVNVIDGHLRTHDPRLAATVLEEMALVLSRGDSDQLVLGVNLSRVATVLRELNPRRRRRG